MNLVLFLLCTATPCTVDYVSVEFYPTLAACEREMEALGKGLCITRPIEIIVQRRNWSTAFPVCCWGDPPLPIPFQETK